MNNFDYFKPKGIEAARELIVSIPNAAFVAGGTNLIDLWKYNLTNPSALIDLNHTGNNITVQEIDSGVRLSAFATNASTAYHPLIENRYPLLAKAILAGASGQIRNMATNGGNLLQRTRCYYFYDPDSPCNKRNPGSGCPAIDGYNRMHAILGTSKHCIAVFPSDMCVALAALDARVNIAGQKSSRCVPFTDFHRLPEDTPELDNTLGHGEIITSIDLPHKGFASNYSYLKIRDRNSYAFALVSVATGLELEGSIIKDARIALGGVAHKPWRIREAEDFLREKQATEKTFESAAAIILSGAQGFKFNKFKIELAKRAIVRNAAMALNPSIQKPGAQPS
ncbi:FAD binding domain-containing protein [Pseudochryseolinea flava]|uniref:Xanthine dehydrogenase family protein subunit M n=1 Tax=Pseudochryseolinea flava TaxID=2059302 RepID=A0A364XXK2_9BACT|nr:xanthine dehydrogenase family protein subunit M [Pseudochryseolinea flava]RAV98967.1 xanthine dehydrogenase family protein subunit M [Pseudochryseolinea flava]